MKKARLLFSVLVPISIYIFSSCKKNVDCESCITGDPFSNKPPVAMAGPDQDIVTYSTALDGTGSFDPDGTIEFYQWYKIAGPDRHSFAHPNVANTGLYDLIPGTYQFQLTVKDNGKLIAKDTVQIIVRDVAASCDISSRQIFSAQLNEIGTLSVPRQFIAIAAAGNKIIFAGGQTANGSVSTVDIYNVTTNIWTTASLSQPKAYATAISNGNKIFIAGGENEDLIMGTQFYSTIDIYDVSTNTWSSAFNLSIPKTEIAGAAIGDKIFFAGGFVDAATAGATNQVDIYTYPDQMSTGVLSNARFGISGTAAGNKIYFAGGWNTSNTFFNEIDIYDNSTGTWDISSLPNGRSHIGSVSVGNKIFWAGGFTYGGATSQVVIRDVVTGATTINCLSKARGAVQAAIKDDDIIFFTGWPHSTEYNLYHKQFDIYNTTTETWSIVMFNEGVRANIFSLNNVVYVVGAVTGSNSQPTNKVYTLSW